MVVGDAVTFLMCCVLCCVAYTIRTICPFVILSEAKNLVVASARVCLFFPLETLSTPQQLYRKDCQLIQSLLSVKCTQTQNASPIQARLVILSVAKNGRSHRPRMSNEYLLKRLNPKHITHPSTLTQARLTQWLVQTLSL